MVGALVAWTFPSQDGGLTATYRGMGLDYLSPAYR